MSIFKHLYAGHRIEFLFSLVNSQSSCLSPLSYYFIFNYFTAISTKFYFNEVWQIVDLFDNPLCDVMSRIGFVENNEPTPAFFSSLNKVWILNKSFWWVNTSKLFCPCKFLIYLYISLCSVFMYLVYEIKSLLLFFSLLSDLWVV